MSSTYVEGPTLRPGKHGIRQEGRRGRRSVSTEPSCFRQQPRTTLASILRSSCRCCVRTDAFVTGTSHTPTCPSRICGPTSTTGPTISTADASSQRQLRQAAAEAGSGRLLPTGIAVLPRTTGFGSIVCCGAGRCGSPRRKRQGSSGTTPVPASNAPTVPAMVSVIPTAPPRCRSRTSPSRPRPRSGCLCFPGVPHGTAVCARPAASHPQKWDTRLADRGRLSDPAVWMTRPTWGSRWIPARTFMPRRYAPEGRCG